MADTGQERKVGALMATLDAFLFGFAGLSALWLGYLVFRESLRPNWQLLLLLVFYLLVAYLLLPRLHRVLTYLYLPGYFIGRARTSDGLLGDPVNIALLGEEQQIHTAMQDAGWTYEFFDGSLLMHDDVTFSEGLVQPGGPGYQALIVFQSELDPDAAAHLLAWAHQSELTVDHMLAMPFYHPVVEEGLRTALRDLIAKLDAQAVLAVASDNQD